MVGILILVVEARGPALVGFTLVGFALVGSTLVVGFDLGNLVFVFLVGHGAFSLRFSFLSWGG